MKVPSPTKHVKKTERYELSRTNLAHGGIRESRLTALVLFRRCDPGQVPYDLVRRVLQLVQIGIVLGDLLRWISHLKDN